MQILHGNHYFIHSLGQDLEETLRFRSLVTFKEEENKWILQTEIFNPSPAQLVLTHPESPATCCPANIFRISQLRGESE